MKTLSFLFTVCFALAGMSGTYTIKPDGSGDFRAFYEAAESLTSQGVSGDCEFIAYTGTYHEHVILSELINNHTYTLTFRPAEGESVTITYGGFECEFVDRLRFTGLVFDDADYGIELRRCNGCRIEACVFRGVAGGIRVLGCDDDTVVRNNITLLDQAPALTFEEAWQRGGHLAANNFILCHHASGEAAAKFETYKSRFVYNTVVSHMDDVSWVLSLADMDTLDVRDNILVLGRECGSEAACLGAFESYKSGLICDYNCYLVESLGHAVQWDSGWLTLPEWQGRGFEAHGLVADPLLVDSTNLHLRLGSPCIGAAIMIPGIFTDIDGDPRHAARPDVGADEYTSGVVGERTTPEASQRLQNPSIVRGTLMGPRDMTEMRPGISDRVPRSALLDATGRRMMDLLPGPNDVRHLTPGVYFVRSTSGVEHGASSVTKVVLTR
jgi:hypothetical protein